MATSLSKICARVFILAALAAEASLANPGVTLWVGDPAPPLKVAAWIKGTPVERFEPGHVYVVELWATKCVPCIAQMPHLSQLARQYAGRASMIGVALLYENQTPDDIRRFVRKKGDTMDYLVAVDSGKWDALAAARRSGMLDTWMLATGVSGAPAIFVVNQAGKLAWIGGRTEELDAVLEKVVEGTQDLMGARAEQEAVLQQENEFLQMSSWAQPVFDAMDQQDYQAAVTQIDRLIAEDSRRERLIYIFKAIALIHLDEEKALAYARGRATDGERFQIAALLAQQDGLSMNAYGFAADFLQRSLDGYPGSHITQWELLARTHARCNRFDRAIEAQRTAIRIAKNMDFDLTEMNKKLQRYQAGAKSMSLH